MIKIFQILFLLVPLFGFSQKDTIAHLYTFGGNNNDNAEEIQATSDGGYVVIGSTSSNSWGNTDAYLLKVDSSCGYQWSQALGGGNNDWGYSIKQTFDKGYIIAASSNSYGNGGYDAVLMKRDSMGNYEWTKVYGGIDWDFAYSVVQTYDSGYVFCGETYNNTNGFSDVYIVKTNSVGDTLWTRTYGGSLIDKGNCVIETSDSNIVVAGIRNTISDSTQAYMIKLSAYGNLIWDSAYGGSGYDDFKGLIQTNDNNYVATGTTTSTSVGDDKDYYVLKADGNGLKIWEQTYAATGHEEGYDVLELANGNLFIIGYTEATGGGGKDSKLFLLTPGGFWGGQNSSFGGSLDEVTKSITFGADGSMKMAGYTNGYGNGLEDVLIIDVDTVVPNHQFTVDTITDGIPLNTEKLSDNLEVLLYPNPTSTYLNVRFSQNISLFKIEIYDIYGRKVKELTVNQQQNIIDLESLPSGLYTITLTSSNNFRTTHKIVVSK